MSHVLDQLRKDMDSSFAHFHIYKKDTFKLNVKLKNNILEQANFKFQL